jgi:hypothetical protein
MGQLYSSIFIYSCLKAGIHNGAAVFKYLYLFMSDKTSSRLPINELNFLVVVTQNWLV